MAYYNECPFCGAKLDPGEKCDCKKEKEHPHPEGIKGCSDQRHTYYTTNV